MVSRALLGEQLSPTADAFVMQGEGVSLGEWIYAGFIFGAIAVAYVISLRCGARSEREMHRVRQFLASPSHVTASPSESAAPQAMDET